MNRKRIHHWLALSILALFCLSACAGPQTMATRAMVKDPALAADSVLTSDGEVLPLQVWPADQPKAIILGLHGMNEYAKTFDMPGPWWAEQGYTVYAYDQRGFGRTNNAGAWPGADILRRDAATILALIKMRHPNTPVYLMGVSMGAAVVLSLMAEADAPDVDGVILVAPGVWGWSSLNPLYKASLWLSAHIAPGWQLTGSGLKIWPSDNIEMLRDNFNDEFIIKGTRADAIYGLVGLMDEGFKSAQKVKAPVLLLYGEKDQIIPRGPVENVLARLNGNTRAALYEAGFHMLLRDLQREVVWRDIVAWISNKKTAFPSAAEWHRKTPI